MHSFGHKEVLERPFLKQDAPLPSSFDSVRKELNDRWIVSLPEALGALTGELLEDERYVDCISETRQSPPVELQNLTTEQLGQYFKFWSQKFQLDECFVENAAGADLPPLGVVEEAISDPAIPESAFIEASLHFPVRDQGSSPTCLAEANVHARQCLCGGDVDDDFVNQYYEKCRDLNGTFGQGLTAEMAFAGAPIFGLFDSVRHYPRVQINLMRSCIAGDGDNPQTPIVMVLKTFASNLRSPASNLFGKWFLPASREASLRPHAVTLVGYQNDKSAPGDGYFFARNFWGEEYGALSGYVGYVRIPYEYVKRYCVCAAAPCVAPPKSRSLKSYCYVLSQGAFGVDSSLCCPGERVIAHPEAPLLFRADTPENLFNFQRAGFAWSDALRVKNFFPQISAETKRAADERLQDSASFMSAAKSDFQDFATRQNRRVWGLARQRASTVEDAADLSEQARAILAELNGFKNEHLQELSEIYHTPFRLDWALRPGAYAETVDSSASVKIWTVNVRRRRAFLVGLFLSPLRYAVDEEPTYVKPRFADVCAVYELVKREFERLAGLRQYDRKRDVVGYAVKFGGGETVDALDGAFDSAPFCVYSHNNERRGANFLFDRV